MKRSTLIIFIVLTIFTSCTKKAEFTANFDNTHNRIWVGKDFWSIPLEDWKVENGQLHCVGTVPNSRVNLLTQVLSPEAGEFEASVKIGLKEESNVPGSAGLLVGLYDEEDSDVRALCYFGKGVNAGVSLQGFAFLNDERAELPEDFDFSEVSITVSGNDSHLKMKVTDKTGKSPDELSLKVEGIQGLVAVANNIILGGNEKPGNSLFSFDELKLSGSKVIAQTENAFGPVLWTMQTLSKGTVKMMALLPPIGENDNQEVSLQLNENGNWNTVANEQIEPDSRTAVFKLENWDASKNTEYRVEYIEKGKDGTETPEYYTGTIRKDPVDRPLKFGGLTCQFTSGYPYTPLVENLTHLEPDMLYFSGDQIYEPNGGYPMKREPVDASILSYLGKYYMFGWAFGDLMRNTPTICSPDDHDVFHGNLWGEGGIAKPGGAGSSDTRGFMQSVEMVNVVNRTQCGQLPDPYDPTPIEQGMSVWYTDLTYGRVSFALISDRIFKTGPEAVSDWEGRHDHMIEPREDLSFLDKPGVEMIGERQTKFLNDWIMDWEGADMKVLLSQTVFANVATHHGSLENYLYGDLDSGGWPKSCRDKVIRLMRKVAAFHINGDQHLSTLVQYGLGSYRDAGWSFNTPAICNFYMRWFLPDERGVPVIDRPEHGYPNTGKYEDAFGNKNFVYAVGNPGKITVDRERRYNNAQIRASGFGFVTFDQKERTIDIDSWRFFADVENPNPVRDQFPGWPKQISQFDNLGMGAENVLPEISVNQPSQVMQIWNEKTGELAQIYRINGNTVQPKLFESGTFTVIIGENKERDAITGLQTKKGENPEKVLVEL
ncbi:alkaline phosphatase D family protein [Mariniphaga sp.]|uniref:alkaline phosphatase D family protein n=1 Tax=Mariniphaga sp. TaxID=1954475 RepID=UPI003564065E